VFVGPFAEAVDNNRVCVCVCVCVCVRARGETRFFEKISCESELLKEKRVFSYRWKTAAWKPITRIRSRFLEAFSRRDATTSRALPSSQRRP